MADQSVKLSDLMKAGKKKPSKPKSFAHNYKDAKAACGKK